MHRLLVLAALLPLAACGPDADGPGTAGVTPFGPDETPTSEAVLDRMRARYAATLGSVDAFTVVAAGAEARYTLADDSTGLDRFFPPQIAPAGDAPVTTLEVQLLTLQIPNVPRLASMLGTPALEGPISRDGRRAFVLVSSEPGTVVGAAGEAFGDSTAAPELRVYVSAETFDVLEIYQSLGGPGDGPGATSRLIYSDFRETDGLVLPWTVRQTETGLNAGYSEGERTVIGGQLGAQRIQIEQMPPGPERDAALADIEAQQRIVADGVAEVTLKVDAVRVGEE